MKILDRARASDDPTVSTPPPDPASTPVQVVDIPSTDHRPEPPSIQNRFENTRRGRAVITVGLIITLAAILIAVLPTSQIKDRLLPVARPYLFALGVGEDWGVFAPNPRTQVIYAGGVIKYSDRSESVWNFPIRPGIMAYSDYRWQKYEEHVRLDSFKGLWQPFATYVVTHGATPGKTPVQISLARRWAEILPPGAPKSIGPWTQYVYYTVKVGGAK